MANEFDEKEKDMTPQDPSMELPEIPAPVDHTEVAPAVEFAEPTPAAPVAKRSGWKMLAAAAALVAVGAGIGSATTFGIARQYLNQTPIGFTEAKSSSVKTVAQTPMESGTSVVPSVYRRISPSVVRIAVSGRSGRAVTQGSGSGFVVDPRGYILTNYHVINGATKIDVKFVDDTVLPATVVSGDRYTDLAVIKVDPGNRSLVAAPLGDSDAVEVGELAIAIGSPFGQEFTVTAGIVSGLERTIVEANNPWSIGGAIQTDASINPGNSGGPLLNGRGEVIGINTAIESPTNGSVGIGFAVPVNTAKRVLPTLLAGGKVEYAWLGVKLGTVDADIAEELGLNVKEGAYVDTVYRDSPAAKAGLKDPLVSRRTGGVVSADVIVEADGKQIKTSDELVEYLKTKKVGDTVTLTVLRDKQRLTVTATMGARPDNLTTTGDE